MTKTTRRTETADEAYSRISADIKAQIETLTVRLEMHRGSHKDRPADWGYVGDLGHVRELLGEVNAFLSGGK